MRSFYSHGKLLLTGEYVVLDGAKALAIPTALGQKLRVVPIKEAQIRWKSVDHKGATWFEGIFNLELDLIASKDEKVARTLLDILKAAKALHPQFLCEETGWQVTTTLEFPRNWGLGSSSTLINNIAQWSKVDAFRLLENSFGGSGYDIAAAQSMGPIFYERKQSAPRVTKVSLPWDFSHEIFFVHLNVKQDSKEGIKAYRKAQGDRSVLERISDISSKMLLCYTLSDFERLMEAHEAIISNLLKLPTVKERLFGDYPRTVKSLGAWGGDFVLATGNEANKDYFRQKGYDTLLSYSEMIL